MSIRFMPLAQILVPLLLWVGERQTEREGGEKKERKKEKRKKRRKENKSREGEGTRRQ